MNKPHKKLDVWAKAVDLAQQLYKATDQFPAQEQFGLTNQARRAALSIPSNIAEGAARKTKKEFIHFLYVARGSLSELDTQLELARRLEYLDQERWNFLDDRLEQVDRMLSGLVRSLRNGDKP